MSSFTPDKKSMRVGKTNHNQEIATYQSNNIFAYQSTWGTSFLRDVITETGSASNSRQGGAILIGTGTTPGSTFDIATRRNGIYQPGRTAEIGIGAQITTKPTGDGWVRIGMFDDNDGFFFQLEANDVIRLCIRRDGVDTFTERDDFNGKKLQGNDPNSTGNQITYDQSNPFIYTIRFSYYGVGPVVFQLNQSVNNVNSRFSEPEMNDLILHTKDIQDFPSIVDPNLPVRIQGNNGTTTTNISVMIGGRRYDILGNYDGDRRITGDYRFGASVASTGLTPLVALRKKAEFPVGAGRNSVNSFAWGIEVYSDTDLVYWVFVGGTINGTWGVPSNRSDTETSLEANIDATTYSDGEPILGPFIIKSTGNGNNVEAGRGGLAKIDIPLLGLEPLVVVATSRTGTASVDATLIVNEDW